MFCALEFWGPRINRGTRSTLLLIDGWTAERQEIFRSVARHLSVSSRITTYITTTQVIFIHYLSAHYTLFLVYVTHQYYRGTSKIYIDLIPEPLGLTLAPEPLGSGIQCHYTVNFLFFPSRNKRSGWTDFNETRDSL